MKIHTATVTDTSQAIIRHQRVRNKVSAATINAVMWLHRRMNHAPASTMVQLFALVHGAVLLYLPRMLKLF